MVPEETGDWPAKELETVLAVTDLKRIIHCISMTVTVSR